MVKAIVFCDIAGTIVQNEPWRYVRWHPFIKRRYRQSAMMRILPLWVASKIHLLSDESFRHHWLVAMATLFRGWQKKQLRDLYEWVVYDQMKEMFYEDVVARLQKHRSEGAKVVLVSGIFQDFVAVYAQRVGADGAIGTRLQFDGDICTGYVEGSTCVGPRKVDFIQNYLRQQYPDISLAECYAYADSYSDRTMLEMVGHGVATYPDDRLRDLAIQKSWEIFPTLKQ